MALTSNFKTKQVNLHTTKLYYILVLMGLISTLASCKRTLETVPVETITKNFVFDPNDSAGINAGAFLSDVYTYIPNGYNRIGAGSDFSTLDLLDAGSDDAISSAVGVSDIQLMETGGLTPFFNPDDAMVNQYNPKRQFYTGIRKATDFIVNIDVVPLKYTLSDGTGRPLKAAWKAEARFLRALFYFELVKRYGGVPLMGDSVYNQGDDVQIPRSSFTACINYIVSECDLAVKDLRLDPVDDLNYGRITQAAALALQCRVLLYADSPLFNEGNIDAGNSLTGNVVADPMRWKRCANAAVDVMRLGIFYLDSNFTHLFVSSRNSEVIFAYIGQQAGSLIEVANGPVGVERGAGKGRTSPTQELVDAFNTINGKPITEDIIDTNTSGYDINDPFKNRDPRLELSILHNGSKWVGTILQTYDGGNSKPGGSIQQTKTGYYMRKFMYDYTNLTTYQSLSYHNFIIFRYGEILLNYAEAANEYLGPTDSVVNTIINLRMRAGIRPGSDSRYGIKPGISQSEMRDLIHNERRVEMAFEEQRFWDIRRWKIAADVYNKPLHGYQILRDPYTGVLTASVQPILTTYFDTKMYLYPIPYSEVVKNENMKQNPLW